MCITAILGTFAKAYGIACFLILLALVSMFCGLTSKYVLATTCCLLAAYVIVALSWLVRGLASELVWR